MKKLISLMVAIGFCLVSTQAFAMTFCQQSGNGHGAFGCNTLSGKGWGVSKIPILVQVMYVRIKTPMQKQLLRSSNTALEQSNATIK